MGTGPFDKLRDLGLRNLGAGDLGLGHLRLSGLGCRRHRRDHRVAGDLRTRRRPQSNGAAMGCGDGVLHLHRLDRDETGSRVDGVAVGDVHGHDGSGQRRHEVGIEDAGRAARVGPSTGGGIAQILGRAGYPD